MNKDNEWWLVYKELKDTTFLRGVTHKGNHNIPGILDKNIKYNYINNISEEISKFSKDMESVLRDIEEARAK